MPIEINRKDHPCPSCKNATIFETDKFYYCIKCGNEFELNDGRLEKRDPHDTILDPEILIQKPSEANNINTEVENDIRGEQVKPINLGLAN